MFKSIVVLLLMLLNISAAVAAPSAFNTAVELYNHRQYGQALTALKALSVSEPSNELVHYYSALCYQALSQRVQAKQEYSWVVSNGKNAVLRRNAQAGVQALDRLPATASSNSGSSGGKSSGSAALPRNGMVTAMLWYTSWCHYCKEFEPRFAAAESKYRGRMNFKRLDGDDPANENLSNKYGIRSYPRLVYVDANGKVIYNENRARFEERVAELARK